MVKDIRETTDNGVAITNDPDEIQVYQEDGMYSDADHRPEDEEDRLGPDPDHELEGEDEEVDADDGETDDSG